MICRRSFLAGIAGCACSAVQAEGGRPPNGFLCAVVDTAISDTLVPAIGASQGAGFSPSVGGFNDDLILSPYGSAFKKDVWTKLDGISPSGPKITLGISFLDEESGQRSAFQSGLKTWLEAGLSKAFDFVIDTPPEKSHVRVTFRSDVNWAAIGRNARNISGPTVRLSDVKPITVLHELGHVFGLQHEHRFPGAVKWNRERVIADASDLFGWDKKTTEDEILNKLQKSAVCLGDPNFNQASVMNYPIPAHWAEFKDQKGNYRPLVIEPAPLLSKGDIACIKGLYRI